MTTSERLTLQDLIDLLAEKQDITKKDAETFLREFVALISETIEGKDFVRIKDFGTFKLTKVNSRRSVDVNTGDPIEIPAHYKLSFTPDKELREGVNKPFSHFESILLDEEVVFEDKEQADNKATIKAAEAKPKKEEPKKAEIKEELVAPAPEVVPVVSVKQEVESAVKEAVLNDIPASEVVEKEEIVDAVREEELSNINDFLTKEVEPKAESIAPKSPPVRKQETPTHRRVRDEEDDDYVDYESLAQQKKKRNIWILVALFALILLGAGIYGYKEYMTVEDTIPYAQDNSKITISDENTTAKSNEEATPKPDEQLGVAPVVEPIVEQPVVVEEPKPAVTQGSKVIEVKSGQTMRALGVEYYGNGAFWVYIFEENRDKISRPDAVFAGMELTIAPASKYDIDPNDKASVKKAQKQEMKLFGEFSEK